MDGKETGMNEDPRLLAMVTERISEKEAVFEKWRNTFGLLAGPALALAVYLTDLPVLSQKAHVLAAILSWTVTWWICEPVPLPVSALLGTMLCVIFGVADAKTVLAPYADPIIYLFLGSFMLARAMGIHGLDKRFAYAILSIRAVGNRSGRILFAFGIVCALLSMWISNTGAAAMMFPIALGIVYAMADLCFKGSDKPVDPLKLRFGTGMMLMAAYAASAGGIATPVGTPPNLIGIAMIRKFCGVNITFFHWMGFAFPLLLILLVLLFLLMYFLHPTEVLRIEGVRAFVADRRAGLGNWTRGQKNVLFCFGVTVIFWLVPGLLAVWFGSDGLAAVLYGKRMPEGVAAVIGASLLFLLPVDWKKREFTLSWDQAVQIDWGTLMLFGGGMALGSLMFETGLAETIGTGLLHVSGAESVWGITFSAIFIAIFVSETSSNTASANMVVPVIISLSQAAGVNPLPPAIGATLGASWGFMLPVSTPPNAIVYGSGMVPITAMLRAGIFFDILGGLLIWAGLYVLLPLAGLA